MAQVSTAQVQCCRTASMLSAPTWRRVWASGARDGGDSMGLTPRTLSARAPTHLGCRAGHCERGRVADRITGKATGSTGA